MVVLCVLCGRRVLNARATRAEASGNPEDLEAVEAWGMVEETFDIVSVQAWNAVVSQVRQGHQGS